MGGVRLSGPSAQSGVDADIVDGTLDRRAAQPPGPVEQDQTRGGGLAPPYIPGLAPRVRTLPSEALPPVLSPEAAAFRDRVRAYLQGFHVPTRVELGHLWNAVPVVSLGESHNETAAIAQVVAHVVLGYGREGDLIGFEGDPKEQAAVDAFIRSGDADLGARAEALRPVLLACRERKVDMAFLGAGASGRTSDAEMFANLRQRTGGQLAGRRILLWTGKAHGLRHHPGSYGEALLPLVVDEVGRDQVSVVTMFSRSGIMHLDMGPHGERVRIALADLSPVLVPTGGPASPFTTARFSYYMAAASKSADFIGIV